MSFHWQHGIYLLDRYNMGCQGACGSSAEFRFLREVAACVTHCSQSHAAMVVSPVALESIIWHSTIRNSSPVLHPLFLLRLLLLLLLLLWLISLLLLQLGDFGLVKLLLGKSYFTNRSGSGTVTHLAPELFQVHDV